MSQILKKSSGSGSSVTSATGTSPIQVNGVSGVPETGAITISLASSGGIYAWTVVTGTSQNAVAGNGYIANNAGTVTVTLPATSAVGDTVSVTGMNNATGWKIGQPNAGSVIHYGTQTTTTGTSGYLSSLNTFDTVTLVCNTANASWIVISSVGNITVN